MTYARDRALAWIAENRDRLRAHTWRFEGSSPLAAIRCATPDGDGCPMSVIHADRTPGASPESDAIGRLATKLDLPVAVAETVAAAADGHAAHSPPVRAALVEACDPGSKSGFQPRRAPENRAE